MRKVRSKAPLRIGLAGGGTDLDIYCNQYEGNVLNATISLYTYCFMEENGKSAISFFSNDLNQSFHFEIGENIIIDGDMALYKAIYLHLKSNYKFTERGFTLETYSDVEVGSGLGGSSTLVVCIINSYNKFFNLNLSKDEIASIAFKIEREDVGIVGGAQDQYAASYGGFNFMHFHKEKVSVHPLELPADIINEFEASTVLYSTKIQRSASQIENEKKSLMNSEESLNAMHSIKQNAIVMNRYLQKGEISKFAKVLHESWENKKQVSNLVSNDHINKIYDLAIEFGAYSGKVSGAGGGGYMFFIVNPQRKISLIKTLMQENGRVVNFKFENQGAQAWEV